MAWMPCARRISRYAAALPALPPSESNVRLTWRLLPLPFLMTVEETGVTPDPGRQMVTGVAVGRGVGLRVGVGTGVGGETVAVTVAVGIIVAVAVAVSVGDGVGVLAPPRPKGPHPPRPTKLSSISKATAASFNSAT